MKKIKRIWSLSLAFVLLCAAVTFAPSGAFAAGGLPDGPGVDDPSAGLPSDPLAPPDGPDDLTEGAPGEAPVPVTPGVEGGEVAGGDGTAVDEVAGGEEADEVDAGQLAPLAVNVCRIGGTYYSSLDGALAFINALPPGSKSTITLLADIYYSGGISIYDKAVTLDLNGYTLDVNNPGEGNIGLFVYGSLLLLDPYNGAFNVVGGKYGVWAFGGSVADVTSVKTVTPDAAGESRGVSSTNAIITVYGDVSAAGAKATGVYSSELVKVYGNVTVTGGESIGVSTESGDVIVDGKINVPGNAAYAIINGIKKNTGDTSPTTKTGYLTYSYGLNSVWVREVPLANAVCEMGGVRYDNVQTAINSIAIAASGTVRLLKNVHHSGAFIVESVNATLDLNGYTLDVSNPEGISGLEVYDGSLLLLDPYNGALNVIGGQYGVYADDVSVVQVTSAKAVTPNPAGESYGVCSAGSTITVYGNVAAAGAKAIGVYNHIGTVAVYGNVTVTGSSSKDSIGVFAEAGNVRIDGKISVPGKATYIRINTTNKTKAENSAFSVKPGYLTYSDGANYVLVKDPNVTFTCEIVETGERFVTLYNPANPVDPDSALGAVLNYYVGVTPHPENAVTIRLLKNININSSFEIINKYITLDLNGHKLNVNNPGTGNVGLHISDHGVLLLRDLGSGAFNVTGGHRGVLVENGCTAELTSVKAGSTGAAGVVAVNAEYGSETTVYGGVSATGLDAIGVWGSNETTTVYGNVSATGPEALAVSGSNGTTTVYGNVSAAGSDAIGLQVNNETAVVYGNVTVTGSANANSAGVVVDDFGEVTVNGVISVTGKATYIRVDGTDKPREDTSAAPYKNGYLTYSEGACTVWVKDPDFRPVCELVGGAKYDNLQQAIDAIPWAGKGVIRMLADHTRDYWILVPGKTVVFDLNGYILDINNPAGPGLIADSGGRVELLDPYNGELNVTGSNHGVSVYDGSFAEMTSAKSTADYTLNAGVHLINGSEAIVYGDVAAPNGAIGVLAETGSDVIVYGRITANPGIAFGPLHTPPLGPLLLSSKPGFFQYSGDSSNVWAKDHDSVCEVIEPGAATGVRFGNLDDALAFVPDYDYMSTNRRMIRLLKDIDYTGGLVIDNQYIIFDLDGYTLNVTNPSGNGLEVKNYGQARLYDKYNADFNGDPYNGEFNVTSNASGASGVSAVSGGFADVTSVVTNGPDSNGVYMEGYLYNEVAIYGNVTVKNGSSGVKMSNDSNGHVTIHGVLSTQAGSDYIEIPGYPNPEIKLPGDYEKDSGGNPATERPGFLEYKSETYSAPRVWVKDPNTAPAFTVTANGKTRPYYGDDGFLDAAEYIRFSLGAGKSAVVQLLQNIDCDNVYMEISDNKTVTLDLNGFVLNVSRLSGGTVFISDGGAIKLLDPYNGEFNVTNEIGPSAALFAYEGKAEVTNVTQNTGGGAAVSVVSGEVVVYGDIVVDNPASYGASLYDGGLLTVHGAVSVPYEETIYLQIAGYDKTKSAGSPSTVKPGYLEYTQSGDASIAWARDPDAYASVENIVGVPEVIAAGEAVTLGGTVVPDYAASKTIAWSLVNAGATGATLSGNGLKAAAPGTLTLRATIANGLGAGVAFTKDFTLTAEASLSMLKIAPTHAILASTADTASFSVSLPAGSLPSESYSKVKWSVDDTSAAKISSANGRDATVSATAAGLSNPKTITVTAIYDNMYKATATVEIVDSATDLSGLNAKLLATSATVNKAKEVGALVPILLTNQGPADFGMSAFGLGALGLAEPEAVGTKVIESIELFDKYGKSLSGQFQARPYGFDDRHIVIDALAGAKSQSGVKMELTLNDAASTVKVAAGTIKLTVTEKYPKISLKAGGLNLAWPTGTASLTATASDGSNVTVRNADVIDTKSKAHIRTVGSYDAFGVSLQTAAKKGTYKARVWLELEGYKSPYKGKDWADVKVKVTNTLPKVKLSKTSVTLLDAMHGNTAATVNLVTSNKKIPFESGYKVKDVELSYTNKSGKAVKNSNVSVSYSAGVISLKPLAGLAKGSALLKVTFAGSPAAVYLKLKIKTAKITSVKPSSSLKSATVNTGYPDDSTIAVLPIKYNVSNYYDEGWKLVAVNGVGSGTAYDNIEAAINLAAKRDKVTLTVKSALALPALTKSDGSAKKYTLAIGSDYLKTAAGAYNTLKFTLTVKGKSAKISSIKLKGAVDIANPASALTATVKLTNASSGIASVKLFPAGDTNEHKLFNSVGATGKTFRIRAANPQVVPGVKHSVDVEVTLENGQTLPLWNITVKPKNSAGKAWQSKKAVTLNRWTPRTGESVGLRLRAPTGVKLGAVRINQACLNGFNLTTDGEAANKSDGFRLAKNGENEWTIYFADETAPIPAGKTYASSLKSSYTLKLELWAEGTYKLGPDGKPVALEYKAANGKITKSKPVMVKVKVNIKG